MVEISNKYYRLQRISARIVLITILTCEMTEVYWGQLNDDVRALRICDSNVYFDFLFRNGMRDRYYQLETDGNSDIKGALTPVLNYEHIEKIADAFFACNPQYIKTSVLTEFQKKFYINRLRRLYSLP